uniref:inositol-phosphate phosphatase n=1 Tax=Trichuris muris TaxID=70415 RepID=A0A5S6QE27_TRIMR
MLIYPRWFNLCVLILSMFFLYLFVLMWQRNPSISFDATVDLKELVALCIMGTLNAGHIARRTPYSTNTSPNFAPKVDRIVGRVISFAVQKFPGVKIVQQRFDEQSDDDVDSLRTNYYALWWKHRLLLEKLASVPVSLRELSVWISPIDFAQEPPSDHAHESIMVCVAVNSRPVFGIIHRPFANETVWGIVGYGCNPNCTRTARVTLLPLEFEPVNPPGHGIALIAQSGSANAGEIVASAFGKNWHVERVNGMGYKFLRVLNGSANFYLHTAAVQKWNLCAADAIFQAAGAQLTSINGAELTYSTEEDSTASGGFLASLDHHYYYLSRMLPVLQAVGS